MGAFRTRVHRASRETNLEPARPSTFGRAESRGAADVAETPNAPGVHSFASIGVRPETTAARTFERAFDADLSRVTVERDGRADALGALAYTQGEQVHLATSAPDTDTHPGRALLGHEVAHVVQQRQGRVDAPRGAKEPIVANASLEAEADRVGASVARGESAPAEMRGVTGTAANAARQGKSGDAPIQMFGALEHKAMGDRGAMQEPYRWDTATEAASGKRDVNYGFTLTHGDIVMLSADLFDPREVDENGVPIPDNLFALARTPGKNGEMLGTQDEIMYAIYRENPRDARFKNVCLVPGSKLDDGSPAPSVTFPLTPDPAKPFQPHFSEEVKKTVDFRYLHLAAKNREHFSEPGGPGSGKPTSGMRRSAGGSYRAMHETAIQAAFEAGQRGDPIDEAMMYEAAAQHFLTDAFSSGHIRTPTGSMRTHWDAIYPNFWENLKRFISHEMAVYMNKEWNLATILGTIDEDIEPDVIKTLEEKIAPYPALGFEGLVRLSTHDVDNREGLNVINDLGERWVAYGDGQLKKPGKGDTMKFAIEAVELGTKDIRDAYRFPMLVIDPLAALQVASPDGPKYRAEQKLPRVDPEYEKTEINQWAAKDLDDLWDNEIRSGTGYTYGMEIERSAKSGDIREQFETMAGMIDAAKEVWQDTVTWCDKVVQPPDTIWRHGEDCSKMQLYMGTLEPRDAFISGVLEPLQSDTKGTLKRIINFDPSAGQAWFNEDDAIMKEIGRMDERDKKANESKKPGEPLQDSLKGLTMDQRATWVESIMDGTFSSVSEEEEGAIVRIFETTPPTDRPLLYRMIEGHPWEGDYQEGFLTWDDELYNSLSGSDLAKVRDLINAGK